MASNMIRVVGRRSLTVSQRALSTTAARPTDVSLTATEKERIYPRIGNRDVVGYGFNGSGSYMDRVEFPCPGIRFGDNTPEVLALKEKEKGDWKILTMADKKSLYRTSFCQTYAEMKAPTGEWKSILAAVISGMAITGWTYMWMKKYVYPEMPHTITEQWQEDQVRNMIAQRQGPVEGLASKFDYEKGEWK